MPLKKQIFCADDWGMSPGINAGILALAEKNLLWSVSLMANADYVSEGLKELLSLQKNGLRFYIHFNLTYGQHKGNFFRDSSLVKSDGSFYDLGHVIRKSYTGQISADECTAIFYHQLDELQGLNVPVSGVDGHHHVHLLPGIAQAVARAQLSRGISEYRVMIDPKHRPSYFQSLMAKAFVNRSGVTLTSCGYALPETLATQENLEKKLQQYERLIIHPAAYDDFDKSGVKDKLKQERIAEFRNIMEYSN